MSVWMAFIFVFQEAAASLDQVFGSDLVVVGFDPFAQVLTVADHDFGIRYSLL